VRFQTHDGGSFFRYGFSLLAPLTVLEKDFELERDAMLSDEATPQIKEKYSVFIVPWIHWALY
jgi:hypothetical protein